MFEAMLPCLTIGGAKHVVQNFSAKGLKGVKFVKVVDPRVNHLSPCHLTEV